MIRFLSFGVFCPFFSLSFSFSIDTSCLRCLFSCVSTALFTGQMKFRRRCNLLSCFPFLVFFCLNERFSLICCFVLILSLQLRDNTPCCRLINIEIFLESTKKTELNALLFFSFCVPTSNSDRVICYFCWMFFA